MRIVHDKIEGNVRLNEDLRLHGMIAGDVTVLARVTLWLHGMVTGDLAIELGGRVELHGTVNGDVINRGELDVWGVISGRLDNNDGAVVHSGAVIHGTSR